MIIIFNCIYIIVIIRVNFILFIIYYYIVDQIYIVYVQLT